MRTEPPIPERFPVDYDAVAKGDVIGRARLAEILGPADAPDYALKLHVFIKRLEAELWDRGKPYTACNVKGEVHVLSDADAAEYQRRMFRLRIRGAFRAHKHLQHVDSGPLEADQRAELSRALVVQGAMLAGLVAARKEVQRLAYVRRTPGLPPTT